ncbi:MAG: beta-ketoacyl synthase N-terminal-like domain-containing protein [Candidatus Sedimenticola sp. (ex Thyasira tokunagai)]
MTNNTATIKAKDLEENLNNDLITIAAEVLKVSKLDLSLDAELLSSGFSSMTLTDFTYQINERYDLCFTPTIFFSHKTIKAFGCYLIAEHKENIHRILASSDKRSVDSSSESRKAMKRNSRINGNTKLYSMKPKVKDREGVAIIGMSGCFPEAPNIPSFWENLLDGKDCIREIPTERWDWQSVNDATNNGEERTALRWGAFLSEIDKFDPLFFGISPREAKLMDPQHRLLLMHAWQAIEDAGYNPEDLAGTKTGVFLGIVDSEYADLAYDCIESIDSYTSTGSVPSMAANRLSYLLDLRGPSEPVETACSSSLVAIHKAITAMEQGECDLAIVGGVNIILSPKEYISFNKAGMLSKDGRCKTFSKQANGYARGEGIGVLVLRRLKKAEQDGHNIHAVIIGSAVNHGGRATSLTAPNPQAQAEVIEEAHMRAGVDPRTIGFIETHGTGTVLGDPVEIDGLKIAFENLYVNGSNDKQVQLHCGIGSVKSNIGHLEMAAGVAGVIKVILQLQHKILIKSLHCEEINPYISLENSPFYVVKENREWDSIQLDNNAASPRRAGISSFGFGGVNSHVILEEYSVAHRNSGNVKRPKAPAKKNSSTAEETHIIPLSAKDMQALLKISKHLKNYLENNPEFAQSNLSDIARTLQLGRQAMTLRVALIVCSSRDFIKKLEDIIQGRERIDIYQPDRESPVRPDDEPGDLNLKTAKPADIARYWVKGGIVDWSKLYKKKRWNRLCLPTYPFTTERHWFDLSGTSKNEATSTESNGRSEECIQSFDSSIMEQISMNPTQEHHSDVVTLSVIDEHIAVLRMEDRISKNMFSSELLYGLKQNLLAVKSNKNLKSLIITGYDNIFCVGGTREGLLDIAKGKSKFTDSPFLYRGLLELDIPVISAIQGHAFGGGFLFGLYADICVLAEEAIYSSNFMQYGFTPGMGATYILGEKLGDALSKEMMFTANNYDGKMLKDRGAQVAIVEQQNVVNEAMRIARQIAKKPRSALTLLKRELTGRMFGPLQDCIDSEVKMHNQSFRTKSVVQEIENHFTKLDNEANTVSRFKNESDTPHKNRLVEAGASSNVRSSVAAGKSGKISLTNLNEFVLDPAEEQALNPTLCDGLTISDIRAYLYSILESRLYLVSHTIDGNRNFKDLGVDSIAGVEIIRDVNQTYHLDLETTVLYDYVNVNDLSSHIANKLAKEKRGKIINPTSFENEEVKQYIKRNSGILSEQNNESIRSALRSIISERLYIDANDLSDTDNFKKLGVDSIAGVEIIKDLNQAYELNLEAIVLNDEHSVDLLSRHISQLLREKSVIDQQVFPVDNTTLLSDKYTGTTRLAIPNEATIRNTDIAIIGISACFPGANDQESFWANISQGVNSITEVPNKKWRIDDYFNEKPNQPGKSYSRWMGTIDDFDKFDAGFFNITPHEAVVIDPQQRVFLETAWHAIEDAGYIGQSLADSNCSVYVGVGHGDYTKRLRENDSYQAHMLTGTSTSILASRLSYLLNLRGQSIAIDTACSSSLVALHEACKSIRSGESDVSIAGGVYISTTEEMHVLTSQANMLAKDGQCKTFDFSADGFVLGEGAGVVLLKRLDKAISDGDNIHAVIKGTGVNQDGATNGITAPSAASQKQLFQSIYDRFDIDPNNIGLVEAHGTGTKLGDPIELKALNEAFAHHGVTPGSCAIGSVKTNIGHTLAAAGIAGLLKVVMALKYKQLPPTLNYSHPNKHINLKESPFYVNTKLKPWLSDRARLAAISSFGFSGTNAHVVVEEYHCDNSITHFGSESTHREHIFLFSAKDKDRLLTLIKNFRIFVNDNKVSLQQRLADVAYTLQVGREALEERLGFVASTTEELEKKLLLVSKGQLSEYEIYHGNSKQNSHSHEQLNYDGELDALVSHWFKSGDLCNLLNVWIKGLELDWSSLYASDPLNLPLRISLPTYPFYRHSYWIEVNCTLNEIPIKSDNTKPPLPELESGKPFVSSGVVSAKTVESDIVEFVARATGIENQDVKTDEHFLETGADSMILMSVITKVQEAFDVEISNHDLYEKYFNVELLAEYVSSNYRVEPSSISDESSATVEANEEVVTI